jgi:hypothetical protein
MNLPAGCIKRVWPYFQVVWKFGVRPVEQVFRIEAFGTGGQRLATKDVEVP